MHSNIPAGSRRRKRRALIAAALSLVTVTVAAPSAAQASLVGFDDRNGSLGVTDVGVENNELVLRVIGDQIVITDSVPFAPVPPSQACRLVTQRQVNCFAGLVNNVFVGTLAGNDTVEYRLPHPGTVALGAGNDRITAGRREAVGRAIQPVRYLPDRFDGANDGFDTINYAGADRGVSLRPEDKLANDGRPGIDRENVDPGFDVIFGSQFDDSPLFGTDLPEVMNGLGGNDVIAGGHGNDLFQSYSAPDGADDYHGGPGYDTIDYFGRTRPVSVSLDNVVNDGESGEGDNVRTNVENIYGGNAGDFFQSHGAFSRLEGRGGDDVLLGGAGPDTVIGGPGNDILNSGQGNDVIDSRDGQLDTIDCSQQTDSLVRDRTERSVVDCEKVTVGKLRLATSSARMTVGKTARWRLSWRHPKAWKQLSTIELRLTRQGVPVGAIMIRARDNRPIDSGAVRLLPNASGLTRDGKTVNARLALRLDSSVAGATLKAEVEATDTRGRRQLERNVARLRVAE